MAIGMLMIGSKFCTYVGTHVPVHMAILWSVGSRIVAAGWLCTCVVAGVVGMEMGQSQEVNNLFTLLQHWQSVVDQPLKRWLLTRLGFITYMDSFVDLTLLMNKDLIKMSHPLIDR